MWVLLPAILAYTNAASIFEQIQKGSCRPIETDLCKDLPYSLTYHPNPIMMSHEQQSPEHFKPLIKTKCNPHIKFFLCSVFAPMCPESLPQAVTSCRSVCEEVRRDCSSILAEFSIEWPEFLNCSRFPPHPELCMRPKDEGKETAPSSHHHRHSSPSKKGGGRSCPADLLNIDPADPEAACAFQCGADVMFSSSDKAAARQWMIIWAGVAAAVSLFAFLTHLIDRKRFKFPERCVFYLSLCYVFHSLPHLFPLSATYARRACERTPTGQAYLIFSSMENEYCVASFALTYYFQTAASLWWAMFAFTWYLCAGRKWVPEGLSACSSYVHLVAWGGSALATIAVLVTQKISASELTGVCSADSLDPQSVLAFHLVPRAALTLIGTVFMLAGFSAMCGERDLFRRRGTDTSKLEKLMVKMGLFCVLYILPAGCQILCDAYAYTVARQWYPATIACKQSGGVEAGACVRPPAPQAELYQLSVLASLASAAACALWAFSPKTLRAWQRVLCCGLCSEAPHKTHATPSSHPLLEPTVPQAPPPHAPPTHYAPLTHTTHHSGHGTWRASKVV